MKTKINGLTPNVTRTSAEQLHSKINADLQKYQSAVGEVRNALIAVQRAKAQKPFPLKFIDSLKSARYFRFQKFESKVK